MGMNRNRQDIAHDDTVTGFCHLAAVHAHTTALHQAGTQGARSHDSGKPEIFVESLAGLSQTFPPF